MNLWKLAKAIKEIGGRLFFVGGAVRDELMGVAPEDFDLMVAGVGLEDGLAALRHFGDPIPVKDDVPVFNLNGVEVAFARKEFSVAPGKHGFKFEVGSHITVEDDLRRRDFTINAMAKDVLTGEIVDPFGGRADIEAKVLRCVAPEHFVESPERPLRLASFAARFPDFDIDFGTLRVCREMAPDFGLVPPDQVWRHFEKMCKKGVAPGRWLATLAAMWWHFEMPVLPALIGVPQDGEHHPEGNVLIHTIHAMNAAGAIARRDGIDPVFLIAAALLHDVGKAATLRVAGGRIATPGHDAVGAEMAREFLLAIRAPHKVVERVSEAVARHMEHINFAGGASPRAVRRLARKLEHISLRELAALAEADHSGRPPKPAGMPPGMVALLAAAEGLDDVKERFVPLMMGRHLIDMGLRPCPRFGDILRAAEEAQIEGVFADVDGGKAWIFKQFEIGA